MKLEYFWTSNDGQIHTLARNPKDDTRVSLVLRFTPRHATERDFMRAQLADLQFTERSTLARIGIEMMSRGKPRFENDAVFLDADAFLFDGSFPNAPYWRELLQPGVPVGRLFRAPPSAKLTASEVWEAVRTNRLKLPQSISIDRKGRVFLTPHAVRYTLKPDLPRESFARLVSGQAGRAYLDKVQIRHSATPIDIAPQAGLLTSCSMYLKEHYVVLNQGQGDFGIHTSAILLDPIKTFGTNIMLEIYNNSDQPVVNPVVSVDIFRAPPVEADPRYETRARRRTRLIKTASALYKCLDRLPAKSDPIAPPQFRTQITVNGQNAAMPNSSLLINEAEFTQLRSGPPPSRLSRGNRSPLAGSIGGRCGYPTIVQALDAAPPDADTLVVDYFPNFPEHIEILSRIHKLKLRRIIFRQPSRTHGFFISSNAHSRFDAWLVLGLQVYWFNESLGDLYLLTEKKGHMFFIREELVRRFQEATIFAFYGSNNGLDQRQTQRISTLFDKLSSFIGTNVGVLTGGGGGVMRLATEQAREHGALTGACFLELEAQPPEIGVDFFNTFQETSRHFRQKWFEAADFCIFNVGGVGTLEEIGIEMCNLKLGIRPRVPYVFFDTHYFRDLRRQLKTMIATKRAPEWMADYAIFTDDPDEVVKFYRKTLQVL
ncbi:LOG family protein [Geminisphaera colitermitum]|uniref:LOG family protein n=1 Tax=Geminisphaera colitermitum TaxID=1148786 RepID=UPI0005BD16B7|nr:LOG family protein [Geminisphaera colitermitum]